MCNYSETFQIGEGPDANGTVSTTSDDLLLIKLATIDAIGMATKVDGTRLCNGPSILQFSSNFGSGAEILVPPSKPGPTYAQIAVTILSFV